MSAATCAACGAPTQQSASTWQCEYCGCANVDRESAPAAPRALSEGAADVHLDLARVALLSESWDEAIGHLDRALAANPRSAVAFAWKALAQCRTMKPGSLGKSWNAAAALLRTAETLEPENALVLDAKAQVLVIGSEALLETVESLAKSAMSAHDAAERLPVIAANTSAILETDCANLLVQLRACKAYLEVAARAGRRASAYAATTAAARARIARIRTQCPSIVMRLRLDERSGAACPDDEAADVAPFVARATPARDLPTRIVRPAAVRAAASVCLLIALVIGAILAPLIMDARANPSKTAPVVIVLVLLLPFLLLALSGWIGLLRGRTYGKVCAYLLGFMLCVVPGLVMLYHLSRPESARFFELAGLLTKVCPKCGRTSVRSAGLMAGTRCTNCGHSVRFVAERRAGG